MSTATQQSLPTLKDLGVDVILNPANYSSVSAFMGYLSKIIGIAQDASGVRTYKLTTSLSTRLLCNNIAIIKNASAFINSCKVYLSSITTGTPQSIYSGIGTIILRRNDFAANQFIKNNKINPTLEKYIDTVCVADSTLVIGDADARTLKEVSTTWVIYCDGTYIIFVPYNTI